MVTNRPSLTRSRDPALVRQRLVQAVGAIILRDGVSGLGVNAVAREAGCDKVLIYRYFGDPDGLYTAFAESQDFWWRVEDLAAGLEGASLGSALKTMLRRHSAEIRRRPITLAVLASEPGAAPSPLVLGLERVREERTLALAEQVGGAFPPSADLDLEAVTLILGAAINYLAVRARTVRVMSGVALETDADWERLHRACDALIDGLLRAD